MHHRAPSARERALRLVVVAVLSFALHALVLFKLVHGGEAVRRSAPQLTGVGASSMVADAEPVDALILISLQDSPKRDESVEAITSRGQEKALASTKIASADARPAPQPPAARSSPDAPEPTSNNAGRAMLFGQYLDQIYARVERAWIRPRTPIVDGQFHCRVRILQGTQGEVREVTMEACNGDLGWQMSLARAIETASPLSAPPDPSVFVPTLVMEFHSATFQAGESEQGFGPMALVAENRVDTP
jgi:hypothetical protein